MPAKDWEWVLDVNLLGVVYGTEVFTPLILSHGEGGHFVNTASMAGMVSPPGMEPYCASKFAVVAMSEGWAAQLAERNVGVSILCPGYVKTRIHESRRNRTDAYGKDDRIPAFDAALSSPVLTGIPPEPVGERVVEAVRNNELYCFTHPEFRGFVEARFQRILAGFDSADASPALAPCSASGSRPVWRGEAWKHLSLPSFMREGPGAQATGGWGLRWRRQTRLSQHAPLRDPDD